MPTMVVDPRIPPTAEHPSPAPRPPTLSGRRVLMFDNGKLDAAYGPYGVLLDRVEVSLHERYPDVTVRRHCDDLLTGQEDRLHRVAADIAADGVDAVVLALCDWGVSQPTAILAARLEAHGVATSVIATPIGASQVLANAARMAPGLPVTVVRSLRSATREQLTAEADELMDDIIGGLVGPSALLQSRFATHTLNAPHAAEPDGRLKIPDGDLSAGFTARMRESLLGDGLPLVAPTEDLVANFLAAAGIEADEPIWPVVPPRSTVVTARSVAAVAVAAGCRAPWAPVVFAAYRAMAEPRFRLFQGAITTHPGGTLVLVSGPAAESMGFAAGRGALGPGFEANATTGRAVALGYSFLLGAIPGGSNLVAQGSPAQFTYCCAENLAESPWAGLHADAGFPDDTTVTVLKCEGPHNVLDQQSTDPARLLGTIASTLATLGSNAAYVAGGETVLMLNPEHARLLAEVGWTKDDVRGYVFDVARNPREALRDRGVGPVWPRWFHAAERIPVMSRPEDLLVTVVGGAGPASQVAIPWGYSRAVTRPVTSGPAGRRPGR